MTEHQSGMRAFQDAAEYDQLDCVNLACLEHMLRRCQLIEYYHKEKVRQANATGSKPVVDLEEQSNFKI